MKEKNREFDIQRGYQIERQACIVWQGGSHKKLQQFLDEGKKMVPFDGRLEFNDKYLLYGNPTFHIF